MYKNGFAEKMKQAREKTGFTRREVSKETGIPISKLLDKAIKLLLKSTNK